MPKPFSCRLFGFPLLSYYLRHDAGWLRLFGVGIGWKDLRRHRLTFGERNGHKRHVRIGYYSFAWLG